MPEDVQVLCDPVPLPMPRKTKGRVTSRLMGITRQSHWASRKRAQGLCGICGKPKAVDLSLCLKHAVQARENARVRMKAKRRNKSRSYLAEDGIR